ncbi:hypothetical protein [Parapontixanthobacter aurantiacus]|uniref:hypothetical protein n=1 Tax=Parapontixanthobacter aurantiacus TaxID=1463599 RepID=UPI00136EEC25|nr:hypothetical protein [Parapontixanthobacter aurantiacus]
MLIKSLIYVQKGARRPEEPLLRETPKPGFRTVNNGENVAAQAISSQFAIFLPQFRHDCRNRANYEA